MGTQLAGAVADGSLVVFRTREPAPRLRHFDYGRTGAYFVTVCVHERRRVLGRVRDTVLVPSDLGRLVAATFERAVRSAPSAQVERVLAMPDHLHAIVHLAPSLDDRAARTSLVQVVASAKACVTRDARNAGLIGETALWQRGFHDRVIRSEDELVVYRGYIDENPRRWTLAGKE